MVTKAPLNGDSGGSNAVQWDSLCKSNSTGSEPWPLAAVISHQAVQGLGEGGRRAFQRGGGGVSDRAGGSGLGREWGWWRPLMPYPNPPPGPAGITPGCSDF